VTPGLDRVRSVPWLWSAIGCAVLWVVVAVMAPVLRYDIVTSNLAEASFLALVALGQMLPVASGGGGIDLSIPFVINFTAFVGVRTVDESLGSVLLALVIALAFGAAVGAANGLVVVQMRVPPIIGTLAVGYIVFTFVQLQAAEGATRMAAGFTSVVRGDALGLPFILFVFVGVAAVIALLVHRTPYGRGLLAVGQSPMAAHLSGVRLKRTILLAYVISGTIAGLVGVLLTASVGSADLEIGNPYLLLSVGAVVLGGNRIAGGTATVVGSFFGALLLTLLVTAVTVADIDPELENVVRGATITLVLVAASGPELVGGRKRRRSAGDAASIDPLTDSRADDVGRLPDGPVMDMDGPLDRVDTTTQRSGQHGEL
jgi:ribose transport system permease protein